jgi:hypothetical protein
MDLPIRDDEGAGITVGRNALDSAVEGGKDARAVSVGSCSRYNTANAQFGVAECGNGLLKFCESILGLGTALADVLAVAVIDNDGKDIG